jgi:hypothetical protein
VKKEALAHMLYILIYDPKEALMRMLYILIYDPKAMLPDAFDPGRAPTTDASTKSDAPSPRSGLPCFAATLE